MAKELIRRLSQFCHIWNKMESIFFWGGVVTGTNIPDSLQAVLVGSGARSSDNASLSDLPQTKDILCFLYLA